MKTWKTTKNNERLNRINLQKFANWLNSWADHDKLLECRTEGKVNDFGRGYDKAISDVFDYLGLKYE